MYFFVCIALLFAACNGQAVVERNAMCKTRNGYYKIDGSCDAYFECRDHKATKMFCPDGLNYNPNTNWPNYPCNYPADMPCIGRGVSQPAKPTADCPRQYGFYSSPLAAENDCGQYRLCVEGRAYDMLCPFGLAFNMATARCDWPELVPNCNAGDYLGFVCPTPEYDSNGNPLITNYRYEGDCYLFYSCQSGRARILSCDPGLAFDPKTSRCVDADLIDCESMYTVKEEEEEKEE